jgi:hypothetical protein
MTNKRYQRNCPDCNVLLPYSCYAAWYHAVKSNDVCWSCSGKHRIIPAGKNNKSWRGYEEIPLTYFNQIKVSAKKRNISFNLTIEYLWELFIKQNKKCVYSNLDLIFSKTRKTAGISTASLDRIDSSKGYVKGNVQWVHKDVNWMKQDFNEEYFINMCNNVSKSREMNHTITPIDIFIKKEIENL